MASFRETLWFKAGLRDEAAAEGTEDPGTPSARLLPLEDRYLDDASLTADDHAQLSLRSGRTGHLPWLAVPSHEPAVPVSALIGELKRGRGKVIAVIAASTACITAVVVLLAL
jgi:hypothetical protein